MIVLKSLHIRKPEAWESSPPNAYKGEIEYVSQSGSMTVYLDAEKIAKILPIVAEALTEQTRKLSHLMTSEILEQVTMLPAPKGQEYPSNPDDPL